MVTGTLLGLGNKLLKEDGLGFCLQMGTDQEGGQKKKSQACDQAFKGIYCFSNLMTLRFGRDQSLEYLGKKIMGLFGVAGLSLGTLEERCLVIFSFRQAPLALVKFYNGLLCSFETNMTLFRLAEVGN